MSIADFPFMYNLINMLEMFIRYGLFTAIILLPIFLLIKHLQNREEKDTGRDPGAPKTERWWGRIGAAIMMFGISVLCMWGAKLFFAELSSLSREGTEITITIVSFDKVETKSSRKRISFNEYYTISYPFGDTEKEKTFIYNSIDAKREFADGEELPAVVQDIATAAELQAPATKASLMRNAWLAGGAIGFLALLFAVAGIRVLTRKPYKLIKSSDGKMRWEM